MRTACVLAQAVLLLCARAAAATLEARVIAPDGTPLEDAAVIAEPAAGTSAPARQRRSIAIEQRGREFIPYLTIVQTGSRVDFPNRDQLKHHVYSFSPAKSFEIKLYSGKPMQPVLFDKPGEVAVGCNIHDWMEAYILVVDSPHFAKTGRDGRAELRDLPPGDYRLRIWHPRQRAAAAPRSLHVGAAAVKTETVVDAAPRLRKPKPPLEVDEY